MSSECKEGGGNYRKFFDIVSKIYDVGVQILTLGQEQKIRSELINLLASHLEVYEALPRILDLCTGTGQMAILTKKKIPYAEVVGIDASPGMLSIAINKAKEEQLDITFKRCDISKLPFEDNSIDGVVSFLCMHELPKELREKVLDEIYRVLRKNGVLAIADYAFPETSFQNAVFKLIMFVEEESAREFISKPLLYDLVRHKFSVVHFSRRLAGFLAFYIARKENSIF